MRSMSKVLILTIIIINMCVISANASDLSSIKKRDSLILSNSENKIDEDNLYKPLYLEAPLLISTSLKSPQEINTIVFVRVNNPKSYCYYRFWMIEDGDIKYLDSLNGYEAKVKISNPKNVEIFVSEVKKNNIIEMRTESLNFKFVEKKEEPLFIKDTDLKFDKELIMWNKPSEIILHHAEAKNFSLDMVHNLHKEKGWGGIGYHYYIGKDGIIYKGRPERAVGVQCISKNTKSLGICLEGDFNHEQMNEKQKKSLIKLINNIKKRYIINEIKGHRDYNETDCPGKNFPMKEILSKVNK